ncbi:MAG: hypothetical protein ACHQET_06225 [Chitinophagales bacterium]
MPEQKEKSWSEEKEKLKLKFEAITDKYAIFDGGKKSSVSEKLRLNLAKTKEELHKAIAAM